MKIINELFKLEPEKLQEMCAKSEFDENHQLIIKKENCIYERNIIFLKQPILAQLSDLLTGLLGKSAIVKENKDGSLLYLLALTETEKYRETLREFYETNHCDQYNCSGLKGFPVGWKEDNDFNFLEV